MGWVLRYMTMITLSLIVVWLAGLIQVKTCWYLSNQWHEPTHRHKVNYTAPKVLWLLIISLCFYYSRQNIASYWAMKIVNWLRTSVMKLQFFTIKHYNNVIMSAMLSQITSFAIVYSSVYSGTDQRKHQSSASLAFVRGIHRWPVNFPHKRPVTLKMFHLMTSSCVFILTKFCPCMYSSRQL